MRLHGTAKVNGKNHLEIGGCDTVEIAEKYCTPLYIMDEKLIRDNCREILKSFKSVYDMIKMAYAGKAFLNLAMCRIVDEEGFSLDVVSGGELYTAIKGDFPAERIIFHGNNKTEEEIKMALDYEVGRIVVDNFHELNRLDEIASLYKKNVDIYIRVSPGIEAHTHDYIKTGHVDSKFGFPIINGQASEAVRIASQLKSLHLRGIHCHIGSQILEIQPFVDAAGIMIKFAAEINARYGAQIDEIDLGGGFGIYYTEGDTTFSRDKLAEAVADKIKECTRQYGLKQPLLIFEPGRSIVGNAGTTLYTVGSVKDIPEIRKYIAVDGGMGDNIRPALYSARYEAAIANRMDDKNSETVTIVGKCCESGDILIKDIDIPEVKENDILAIFSTGAYGQSMSSNYNRIPKPAVVLVNDGLSYIISKRETYDEIIRNDVLPERLIKNI